MQARRQKSAMGRAVCVRFQLKTPKKSLRPNLVQTLLKSKPTKNMLHANGGEESILYSRAKARLKSAKNVLFSISSLPNREAIAPLATLLVLCVY